MNNRTLALGSGNLTLRTFSISEPKKALQEISGEASQLIRVGLKLRGNYQLANIGPHRGLYWQQDCQQERQRFLPRVALGIVGAVVGGFLFSLLGAQGITGLNVYSMIVAIIGSVVVLWGYHAVTGR